MPFHRLPIDGALCSIIPTNDSHLLRHGICIAHEAGCCISVSCRRKPGPQLRRAKLKILARQMSQMKCARVCLYTVKISLCVRTHHICAQRKRWHSLRYCFAFSRNVKTHYLNAKRGRSPARRGVQFTGI